MHQIKMKLNMIKGLIDESVAPTPKKQNSDKS